MENWPLAALDIGLDCAHVHQKSRDMLKGNSPTDGNPTCIPLELPRGAKACARYCLCSLENLGPAWAKRGTPHSPHTAVASRAVEMTELSSGCRGSIRSFPRDPEFPEGVGSSRCRRLQRAPEAIPSPGLPQPSAELWSSLVLLRGKLISSGKTPR